MRDTLEDAKSFVRDVLVNCFHQQADEATVRVVAQRVMKAMPPQPRARPKSKIGLCA